MWEVHNQHGADTETEGVVKRLEDQLQRTVVSWSRKKITDYAAHFWTRVRCGAPDQCWEWTGAVLHSGHGYCWNGKRTLHAHRYAYEISKGAIPAGLLVCHACDNPKCCNPSHLWLGTQKDNMHDCIAKGRHSAPPRTDWPSVMRTRPHHWQKLTIKQVKEIKARLRRGNETQTRIAADYDVKDNIISQIKLGKRWSHVAE